jgi:hypothetical protein
MRRFTLSCQKLATKLPLALAGLLVLSSLGHAQVPVQPSATNQQAATQAATISSSAGTLTLTPSPGQYVYVTALDIENCAGLSAVTPAVVTTITTTGFGGISSGPIWTVGSGAAAGLCQPTISPAFANGLKSAAPGTAVTFVLPTFATNQTIRLNVNYYFAS